MQKQSQVSARFAGFAAAALLLGALACPALLAAQQSVPAQAAPARQVPIYTPTPGPDGRIIYIVQARDTLISISLLTGVPVEELMRLNNLPDENIQEGQSLLLGYAGPLEVTFTPGPSPTLADVTPTPTPEPGSGRICVLLYNDVNGDSIRQEEEESIPGGAISISNRSGSVAFSDTTAPGLDPSCFEPIPEGTYNVSVAVPEGYNATTDSNYSLPVRAGDITHLGFGAQANTETIAESPALVDEPGKSPFLGILGAVLLLAGIGLGVGAGLTMRGR